MFLQTVGASFLALCNSIDTPRSLTCALLWKHGEHSQLLELTINSEDYHAEAPTRFRDDYLVTEYLRKYPCLMVDIDTGAAAYDGFAAAENTCRKKNREISNYPRGIPPNLMRVISRAQALIEETIGSEPPFSKICDSAKWGKGSTFSLKGEDVRLDAKVLEDKISITRLALPWFRAAIADDYAWLHARGIHAEGPVSLTSSEFNIVRGCRTTVVPKNAKTDRTIAIEPSGNIFLQLGFGAHIRQCLLRIGINLNDQTMNQELARLGVALGLATVDLKAASDTICRELVWLLLPFRWACALDSVRSHEAFGSHLNDDWSILHKFSSMGNGFTFELESLIFWALTKALCDVERHAGPVSVYGDDIIMPNSAYAGLVELMDYCGFTVNTKKSHVASLFRESCGKHYFKGTDVTPIYQKEALDSVEAFYRHHNRWAYHASDRGHVAGDTLLCDKKLRDTLRLARYNRMDNPHLIPLMAGDERTLDGGLVTDRRSLDVRFTGYGFRARSWVFTPDTEPAMEQAMYAAATRLSSQKRRPNSDHDAVVMIERRPRQIKSLFLRSRRTYMEIATRLQLALPFDGTVTLRDRGSWSTRKRVYGQMCDLRWV